MSFRPQDEGESRRKDREARLAAQTEFKAPIALQAGAGTGKTTTLVARILAWALGSGWVQAQDERVESRNGDDPSEREIAAGVLAGITAITFTDAAAAEMASRVSEGLAVVARGDGKHPVGLCLETLQPLASHEERTQRARALLGEMDHLNVSTIHSFCKTLLGRHPLEAGNHPEVEVDADGRRLEEVVREVVEQRIALGYEGIKGDPLLYLASHRIGPDAIAEALQFLASSGIPASLLERDPFSAEAAAHHLSRLDRLMRQLLAAAGGTLVVKRAPKTTEVETAIHSTLALIANADLASTAAIQSFVQSLEFFWGGCSSRLAKWGNSDFNQSESTTWSGRTDSIARAAAPLHGTIENFLSWDPLLFGAARTVLQPLLKSVQSRLTGRGVLTFNDLLLQAQRLLKSSPAVARAERRRIRQLLVDEFQDTDRCQCDLVRRLALEGSDPRPGLFVVGDPKQSIYGWRNADLEAYESLLEDMQAHGGPPPMVLTNNFRSLAAVLEEVDRVVEPVMAYTRGLQPKYEPLVPGRPDAFEIDLPEECAPVEYWVSWKKCDDAEDKCGPATGADAAAQIEAEAIARDIRRLHDGAGLEFGDFGILLRSRGNLPVFVEALRKCGVPFVVGRDRDYYQRKEVVEAAAFVQCIVQPTDQLALVAALRSAAVGVPDVAWAPLWEHGFPSSMARLQADDRASLEPIETTVRRVAAQVPSDIPGLDRIRGWEESLIAAVTNIAALRVAFRAQPIDRFLEEARTRLLIEVTEGARYQGAFRLANLDRFFRELESALEDGGGDVDQVLRALQRSVRRADEAAEARPMDLADQAVQLTTIHSAKGLQFEHVYLAQLQTVPGAGRSKGLDIDERWANEDVLRYTLFSAASPDFDQVLDHRRRVGSAEQIRTLYVAMTRAKKRLVMLGSWPDKAKLRDPEDSRSYQELLLHRSPQPESLEDLAEAAIAAEAAVESAAAVWKFPDLEPSTADRGFSSPKVPNLPSSARIESDTAYLESHRLQANERMERPWSGAASSESGARLEELFRSMPAPDEGDRTANRIARVIGTLVHRFFETLDLGTERKDAVARVREQMAWALPQSFHGAELATAHERAEGLIQRIERGDLLGRLLSLESAVVGREVPVLRQGGSGSGPVGFVSGFIDLVYRDPDDNRWVIADYKTDIVQTPEEIGRRAEAYDPQERIYARALQQALNLDQPPRTQLWFLWADTLWENRGPKEL